jgi:hypothetical protein
LKQNLAIYGLSRSGKTTKAKEFFDTFTPDGCAIFVNSQFENYFGVPGVDWDKWTITAPKTVIEPMDRAGLTGFIEKLFKIQQKSKQKKPIRIIIDEVFLYMDYKGAEDAVIKLCVDGLRWNIQTIITAHMPHLISYKIHKNIHVVYFFQLNPGIYDYFSRVYKIDMFQFETYLSAPGAYNYIMYDMRTFYKKEAAPVVSAQIPKA